MGRKLTVKISKNDHSKGILDFGKALEKFSLDRFPAPPSLAPWVEGFWQVSWNLQGREEHFQSNISHASVNIAFEEDGVWLYGVPDRLFVRRIGGRGWVFGIKFLPGGFHPFAETDVSAWTGKRVPLESLWGDAAAVWGGEVLAAEGAQERLGLGVRFLEERKPAESARSSALAARLLTESALRHVDQAASAMNLDERSLQRLFKTEVGIGPKEVLRRFRLQGAAERLAREPGLSCGDLALDLGYADQAHFTKDFKAVVGRPPKVYQSQQTIGR